MGLNEFLDNSKNEVVTTNEFMPLVNQIVELENRLTEAKKIEQQIKDTKEQLKQAMTNSNVYKWETPNGIKITLIADTEDTEEEQMVVDEEAFIKNEQEIRDMYFNARKKYEKLEKVTIKGKKGYVRITLPKEKNND